jgi:hypothetical protein
VGSPPLPRGLKTYLYLASNQWTVSFSSLSPLRVPLVSILVVQAPIAIDMFHRCSWWRAISFGTTNLNRISVVGIVHDVQVGFLGDTAVTQFNLTCNTARFGDTTTEDLTVSSSNAAMDEKKDSVGSAKGSPASPQTSGGLKNPTALSAPAATAGSASNSTFIGQVPFERDNYTVRCLGEKADEVAKSLSDGFVVRVTGRFRMNPQSEPAQNREKLFPYIQLGPDPASVSTGLEILQGSKRRARTEAALKAVDAVLTEQKAKPVSSVVRPS